MLEFNFHPFPTLETERLVLKQITQTDVHEVFRLRSDPRVMSFIDRPIATKLQDAASLIKVIEDLLAANDGITWGICFKDDMKVIGTIGFWRNDKQNHRGEIGYALHTDFHRKGIMQEAFIPAFKYGFETMKLHSVEANVNPRNLASINLLKKFSFVQEAYFKENYYSNGQFLDSAIFSLLTPLK
jgi:ribosomal-protein-alanine N-acetyltransferase